MKEEFYNESMIWQQQPYEKPNLVYTEVFKRYLTQDPQYRDPTAAYKEYLVEEKGYTVEQIITEKAAAFHGVKRAAKGNDPGQVETANSLGIKVIPWEERAKAYDEWNKSSARSMAKRAYLNEFINQEKADYKTMLGTWRTMWDNFTQDQQRKFSLGQTLTRPDAARVDSLVRARLNITKAGQHAYSSERDTLIIKDLEDDKEGGLIEIQYINPNDK